MNEAKTWKWAVPAGISIVLFVVCARLYLSTNPNAQYGIMLAAGFMVLCVAISMVNLWRLITEHIEYINTEHQAALNETPLVKLAESMRQMHPDAVKVLNRFGVRTTWDVTINLGQRDWILQGTNVHLGFVEWIMDHSGVAMFPKYRLGEGSKKWDPDGMITDREQYEQLELWLYSRLMVTRNHGDYKPPEFIPPWTPAMVMEMMGMTGEQDLYQPEEVARQNLNGNGNGQKPVANAVKPEPAIDERPLGEDELLAISLEEEAMSKKYDV